MQDKTKDEGDQALIRRQRSEQERSNGKPDRATDSRRALNEHRGNGEPDPDPIAQSERRRDPGD